jgi:bacillolysin
MVAIGGFFMKIRKVFYGLVAFIFLAGLASVLIARPSAAQPSDPVEVLRQQTGGAVRASYHAETGVVRFIGTDRSHPMPQPVALKAEATAEEAARQFLGAYGSAFGLTDPVQELTVERSKATEDGRSVVRFQQEYQGIPVVGGELIVNMDAEKNVLSVSGETLPDINLDTTASLDAEAARQQAIAMVAKNYTASADSLTTTTPELWVFNPALLGGPGPRITALVWRMDVTSIDLLTVKELVLVEAHTGAVVLNFNQIDTVLTRTVYDNLNTRSENLALNPAVCTEGNCPGSGNDTNFAYDFAGDTYNFYSTNHSRDSLDGAGMGIISTVRYCPTNLIDPCPYPNAFWNGQQMVYGEGYASGDDVVGHEMTHGVTDHESSLFYYYQSGAINESFSDVWGEFIDQSNTYDGSGGSVRWLMGEDLPIGAIRSMSDPTIYGDPDRMSSSNYYCKLGDGNENDRGGVHINSGVNNKAAYLMTDGGSFNGQTVAGLGIAKVADIYYEVQTNLFTTASDYQDLYDGLIQACSNLVGVGGITAADCQEVQKAALAVEMNIQPSGCAASEAPICAAGQTPTNIFFDNLENTASGNWATGPVSGSENQWYYPQNTNPFGFDATYATSGSYNFWGYDVETTADYAIAMNNNVTLPAGTVYMHFRHAYGFEEITYPYVEYYDGGVLEYSANGGVWTDAGSLITENGYNGTISTVDTNPLGGRSGFITNSYGYTSSRLNLSSLAGQNVKFRFRIGTDSGGWDWGWFIDDIRIYTCGALVPTPTRTVTPTKTNTPIGWTPPAAKDNYLPYLRKDKTPTPTITPTNTPAVPTAAPSAPLPGFWVQNDSCNGCSEFYVTTDSAYVDNFAVFISVSGCGNYKVTHTPLVAIKNKAFEFTGKFFANGTFDTYYSAHGKTGFKNFYISGCGYITGSMSYSSAWYNNSQPFTVEEQEWLVEPVTVWPAQVEKGFIVTKEDE